MISIFLNIAIDKIIHLHHRWKIFSHNVVWDSKGTFGYVFDKNVKYVHRNFGHNGTMVFDGFTKYIENIQAVEVEKYFHFVRTFLIDL